MKIELNNNNIEITNSITVDGLIQSQNISSKGIAIAVNQTVISKADWQAIQLKENDHVTIIKATQGG